MDDARLTVLCGDAEVMLRTLPDESVHCCITSPPYYGLRDYGIDGQIGLEDSPEAYVARLVAVFREVRRVLRKDGTCWVVIGDSYCNYRPGNYDDNRAHSFGGPRTEDKKRCMPSDPYSCKRGRVIEGLKEKDLIGIPWRVAFALQADGWWLRQDIIWAKPNSMPESVTDRCTKSHEYVFLLAKSERYYWDALAIAEPTAPATFGRYQRGIGENHKMVGGAPGQTPHSISQARTHDSARQAPPTRNRRSVWTVATQPYPEAHFATYPPELIKPMILAGCPERCCPECGKGWERVVERESGPVGEARGYHVDAPRPGGHQAPVAYHRSKVYAHSTQVGGKPDRAQPLGWQPSCNCGIEQIIPGVVLDPFAGTGTTGMVALEQGRHAILIELNAEYLPQIERRCAAAKAQERMVLT